MSCTTHNYNNSKVSVLQEEANMEGDREGRMPVQSMLLYSFNES